MVGEGAAAAGAGGVGSGGGGGSGEGSGEDSDAGMISESADSCTTGVADPGDAGSGEDSAAGAEGAGGISSPATGTDESVMSLSRSKLYQNKSKETQTEARVREVPKRFPQLQRT